MADKLMRTTVVMTFFLILALFSGCGTDGTSQSNAEAGPQITMPSGDSATLAVESTP
jgi:hypothetical protein